jgi:hypothetical protein
MGPEVLEFPAMVLMAKAPTPVMVLMALELI